MSPTSDATDEGEGASPPQQSVERAAGRAEAAARLSAMPSSSVPTYLGAAIVPLWPYFFFSLGVALATSLACTLLALFSVGLAKGRITRLSCCAPVSR